jgi:hypothetical protein
MASLSGSANRLYLKQALAASRPAAVRSNEVAFARNPLRHPPLPLQTSGVLGPSGGCPVAPRTEPSTEFADAEQPKRFLVGTAWIELLQQTVEHRVWRGHAGKERGG